MTSNLDIPPGCHLGHLVFEYLRRHQDRLSQIDAATGEKENYASVLKRSIGLAKALRASGLNPGDVLAIGGLNHLDICIPYYAALFNGLPIVGVDPNFKYDEVRTLFELTAPKIAFCQKASCDIYAKAATDLRLDLKLVTFDEGDCTMSNFIQMHDKAEPEADFRVAEYNVEKVYPFLITTSGSGSKVKVAAFKNKALLLKCKMWPRQTQKQPDRNKKTLVLSPVHWISSYFAPLLAATAGHIRVQTSKPNNLDHIVDIINKYRPKSFTVRHGLLVANISTSSMLQPQATLISPTFISSLLTLKEKVDLTSFRTITLTGSKVYAEILTEFKKLLSENCIVKELYGQTEMIGPVLFPNPFGPAGNCGKRTDMYIIKLVDPDTRAEIKEANVTGEILVKGPCFSEYYNDPIETAQAFTEDGFFKTGDLLYRDEDNNYFFVDRIKSLIKYRGTQVIPAELEELINRHPGVKDVCIVGIDDPVDGQRSVACVVRQNGCEVTEDEIKDLVAEKVSNNKHLQGVLFVDSLPYVSTGKLARIKIREMVWNAERE